MLQILIFADKAQTRAEEMSFIVRNRLIQQITFRSVFGVGALLTHQATLTTWLLSFSFTA